MKILSPLQSQRLAETYGGNVIPFIPYAGAGAGRIRFRSIGGYSSIKFKNATYEGFPLITTTDSWHFLCLRRVDSREDHSRVPFSPPMGVIDAIVSDCVEE